MKKTWMLPDPGRHRLARAILPIQIDQFARLFVTSRTSQVVNNKKQFSSYPFNQFYQFQDGKT